MAKSEAKLMYEPTICNLDNLSDLEKSIFHIALSNDESDLGSGTGFLWREGNANFLISNLHVFSGQGFSKKSGSKPNEQTCPRYIKLTSNDSKCLATLPLYDGTKPLWIESTPHGDGTPSADIAILPIDNIDATSLNTTLIANKGHSTMIVEPTMPLSSIGYPLEKARLIWATGYAAESITETSAEFLANVFPYEGMSGSPVFWINNNRPIKVHPKGAMVNSSSNGFIQFLGVYSGRMLDAQKRNEYPLPLARIWKPSVIKEILSSNLPSLEW